MENEGKSVPDHTANRSCAKNLSTDEKKSKVDSGMVACSYTVTARLMDDRRRVCHRRVVIRFL